MFDHFISLWSLKPDGEPIVTPSSHLLPVLWSDRQAMLKIAHTQDERAGGVLLQWWEGDGAACVYARQENAVLIERAPAGRSLLSMAAGSRDDKATAIACRVARRLHEPRAKPLPTLVPLHERFAALETAAPLHGDVFAAAWSVAKDLLTEPVDICVLHGDIHHGNILDFGDGDWRAIDPKGLYGERGFDFANPDLSDIFSAGRLRRQLPLVPVDQRRLLEWIAAYSALSAAWFEQDGMFDKVLPQLHVSRIALNELVS